ncbi:MAG: hypothetical protein K0R39_3117 [Symbiobacteriaceae bacterium]|jgi:hypothetical protein|nr:hypothetical protein [Symbiobacteriaceae bacterium]
MRQVVRAPNRTYVPYIVGGALFVAQVIRPWSDLTWQDLLIVLGIFTPFLALGLFFLRLITSMTITITDQSLVVREEVICLDQITECFVEEAPTGVSALSYKLRTDNRLVMPVPDIDALVVVTLDDGRQVAFSSDDPEAVIQTLRRVCGNLSS